MMLYSSFERENNGQQEETTFGYSKSSYLANVIWSHNHNIYIVQINIK